MNKDTLLEEVRKLEFSLNLAEQNSDIDRYLADDVWHLIDCINKLDEPQKPIIPQFVADYIEKWEHEGLTIYEWFSFGNNDVDEDVNKWLYDNTMEENRRREYLLINAIRDGYEVEKEKLYFVKEPVTGQFLIRDDSQSRGVKWVDGFSTSPSYFTEAEIKAIDKRYWDFV